MLLNCNIHNNNNKKTKFLPEIERRYLTSDYYGLGTDIKVL